MHRGAPTVIKRQTTLTSANAAAPASMLHAWVPPASIRQAHRARPGAALRRLAYAARGAGGPKNNTLSEVDIAWLRGKSFEEVLGALKATGGNAFAVGRSALRGVSWCKGKSAWKAQARWQGSMIHLGQYKTDGAAARAYDAAARRIFRRCANLGLRLCIARRAPPHPDTTARFSPLCVLQRCKAQPCGLGR